VWFDQNLRPGDNWPDQINRNIEIAEAVLVVISPASLQSEWVNREWTAALARNLQGGSRSRRIIPVLIGGASFSDLPPVLRDIQAVDLNRDYEGGMERIAQAIEYLRASKEPPASAVIDRQSIIEDVTAQVMERLGLGRSSSASGPEPPDDKLVFVVCTFTPEMEPIFDAIAAAAEAVGLRAERVKDVKGDYRITDKVLTLIRTARLVVVDLTYERPNVYFELGYARGLDKTVITILRAGAIAHFDVRDWAYLEYIDSRPLERQLRERFGFELGESAS
jgi:hypothetical protein